MCLHLHIHQDLLRMPHPFFLGKLFLEKTPVPKVPNNILKKPPFCSFDFIFNCFSDSF